MKLAKIIFALLLCGTLFVGLATPAFADESAFVDAPAFADEPTFADEPAFTIAADKKMAASGESITLTAVNAPQPQAGQSVQYRWYFSIYGVESGLIGTTTDAVIQTDAVKPTTFRSPFTQQFPIEYSCVLDIVDDASGTVVASYTSSKIDVLGYYSLSDSFAVPYDYLVEALVYILLVPGYVFFEPMLLLRAFACFFGILWSPWVAVANGAEAKRVNG